ncbi:hypothetical protein [Spongiactinospora sp. TRM90649]|uniref:hypothetical protein n=1 Tax=Spongiactinospora sp. TRM90649 TaxID=3031114 RepID=UPI0023F63733|nr:hypothetical protein [Spongiactinospora sp. TRM90649]MDF5758616.1 hypothetical protein [Spongiactinospora sp. TRM90649]
MADYAPQAVTVDGLVATARTAAGGDKLTDPGDRREIRVTNGGGAPITLTITPPGSTDYGVANPAKVFTITNATSRRIPVLAAYGDPADGGKVALTWSATTSVTFEYTRS